MRSVDHLLGNSEGAIEWLVVDELLSSMYNASRGYGPHLVTMIRHRFGGGIRLGTLWGTCVDVKELGTWLILPVVICLSQRLSHACLSISNYTVKLRMAH